MFCAGAKGGVFRCMLQHEEWVPQVPRIRGPGIQRTINARPDLQEQWFAPQHLHKDDRALAPATQIQLDHATRDRLIVMQCAIRCAIRCGSIVALVLTGCATARAQWTIENSGTTADLRGIDNVGAGVAWASGTNGTVLRTEDGGYVWQACTIPPGAEHLDFRGIQAFDANTAIVMSSGKGDLSRLYKTTDGCHTWKLIFTNPDLDGFWDTFFAGREGDEEPELLVIGDPVDGRFATFQTFGDEDGAQQLKKFDAGGLRADPGEALFAASNSSMAINVDRLTGIFGTGGANGSRIFVMCSSCEGDDGWKSARLKHFATGVTAGVFSVANLDRVWVAVGGDYSKPTEGTVNSAFSVDDGAIWNLSSGFPPRLPLRRRLRCRRENLDHRRPQRHRYLHRRRQELARSPSRRRIARSGRR